MQFSQGIGSGSEAKANFLQDCRGNHAREVAMNWFSSVVKSVKGMKTKRQHSRQKTSQCRLSIERLEDRCVPSTVSELPGLPTANAAPTGITTAYDGSIWFTERNANKLGRLANGMLTEYAVPTANCAPEQITASPDGNVWFTERYGRNIGRISQSGGTVAEFHVPGTGAYPTAITTDPAGKVWFASADLAATGRIGSISSTGVISQLATGATRTTITGMVGSPDGNLWVTEVSNYWGDAVAKVTTTGYGRFTNYRLANRSASPQSITVGPDHNLWFTEAGAGRIGQITVSGAITEYTLAAGSNPQQIVAGPDGAVWFTEKGTNKIGRMTTDGHLTELSIPTGSSQPLGLTRAQDGSLYFTEQSGDRLGRVVV
jgi:virginiamycin B lyase